MKHTRFLLIFPLLAACAQATPPQPSGPTVPDAASDTCGGAAYGYLIGQKANALERVLIMRQVRIIHPDTMVTMDHRPARLNFTINADGLIARISCG
ncbi:hypothetical protein BVG79_00300 [Ketogulonicigenium robustum]|uniref:Peptidase inhibitor I78 family protein n=1 Tax=Ketogulonicigenium robustum TaxID=92947 RepID=A0A1W6NWL6_9RHOB|nr:I78 family peptidase inhibitor [Ketogulonicigenium robustum]ARO13658.1 hypothetical protein BVG79_00300 [Ketogulonicigenium robustum]